MPQEQLENAKALFSEQEEFIRKKDIQIENLIQILLYTHKKYLGILLKRVPRLMDKYACLRI